MRHKDKREKTKHQKKRKWWDTSYARACVYGDKNFVKRLSRLRGRKIRYIRSSTNGITEAISIFHIMKAVRND